MLSTIKYTIKSAWAVHMRIAASFILLSVLSSSVQAQYYSKRYPVYENTNSFISSIQVVNDTIYSMYSLLDTIYPYYPIGAIDKFDKQGNRLSTVLIQIPNSTSIGVNFNNLIVTNDGGFAFGCVIQDTAQAQNAILFLKYDAQGTLVWYKEIRDTLYTNLYCGGLIQDGSSNYYLTGGGTRTTTNINDAYVIKLDSFGNLIYNKVFSPRGWVNSIFGICINKKGHIVFGGLMIANAVNSDTIKEYTEIYELDSNGNQLNYVLGTDTNGPPAYFITPTYDGEYIIANGYDCFKDVNGVESVGCVAKLDSNFHIVWKMDMGPCSEFTGFYALKQSPDGNYIAVGQWADLDTTATHLDGWIIKFTEGGQILWSKQYRGVSSDGENGDYNGLYSIAFMSDGSIICAGEATNNDDTIPPRQQGWLLHLDSAGCLPDSINCGIVAGMATVSPSSARIHVYPNPSTEQVQFETTLNEPMTYTLSISSILGQSIFESSFSQPIANIDVRRWPSGLYLYRVNSESGIQGSGKFVVSH